MRLSKAEREVHCYLDDEGRVWALWTEIPRYARKFARLGYKQAADGEWVAPERAISFRRIAKTQRSAAAKAASAASLSKARKAVR